MEIIFGVIHGDLYYHIRADNKMTQPFIRICRATPLDETYTSFAVIKGDI